MKFFYSMTLFTLLFLVSFFISRNLLAQPMVRFLGEGETINWRTAPTLEPIRFDCGPPTSEELIGWKDFFGMVRPLITDERIYDMSHWARKEMLDFRFVPSIPLSLERYGCNEQYIIYRSKITDLPSHSPVVFRYLEAYILGVSMLNYFAPNELIVTIGGHTEE